MVQDHVSTEVDFRALSAGHQRTWTSVWVGEVEDHHLVVQWDSDQVLCSLGLSRHL